MIGNMVVIVHFFSHFQSGAYRLENDNTIITVTQQKIFFEINNLGQIVCGNFFMKT